MPISTAFASTSMATARARAPRSAPRWLALLCVLAAASGVQASGDVLEAPSTERGLLARIQAEVGEARCSADSECRTLPIGAKACGGPERWLAWSVAPGRERQLQDWAGQLAAQARQRNAGSGMVSNCQYNADPGAVCQAGRCTLGVGQRNGAR